MTKVVAHIDYEDIGDSNGLYVWVNPDERSTNMLLRMLATAPFKTYDGTELHCTVMHSRDFPQSAAPIADRKCFAVLEAFLTWQDHKNRTIVVAALSSPDLEHLHEELKQQGCVHGYPEYNPHITVGKGVELDADTRMWIQSTNKWLESHELVLAFSPQLRGSPLG
jgi:2'-5' RNA ligase